ncbi:MAG: hypothetical protein WCP69_02750 [Bacteroidota bacterium]
MISYKKAKTFLILFTLLFVSFQATAFNGLLKTRDKDIFSLQKKGIKQIIAFTNDSYDYVKQSIQCNYHTSYSFDFLFLLYKNKGINYIVVYYIKSVKKHKNRPSEPRIGKKRFDGFDPSSLWLFYDTCKVLEPKCDTSWTCDDCGGSQIDFYCGENKTTYYYSGKLHTFCPDSPYLKFMDQVSDSIKKFVFDSKRFDVKIKCY